MSSQRTLHPGDALGTAIPFTFSSIFSGTFYHLEGSDHKSWGSHCEAI